YAGARTRVCRRGCQAGRDGVAFGRYVRLEDARVAPAAAGRRRRDPRERRAERRARRSLLAGGTAAAADRRGQCTAAGRPAGAGAVVEGVPEKRGPRFACCSRARSPARTIASDFAAGCAAARTRQQAFRRRTIRSRRARAATEVRTRWLMQVRW